MKIWKDKRSWNEIKIIISDDSWPSRSDHICQAFHIDHLTKEDKKNHSITKDQTRTKMSLILWGWYGQRRFRGWDLLERKPTRSLTRLKQKEIIEKLKCYYDVGISAAEVIRKYIPGLMPRTIYNHYKLFKWKNGQFKKERKWKKIYNFKRYWLKFENLIKEDDLLNL